MDESVNWQVGDRVNVCPTRYERDWTTGTVVGFYPNGGVHVKLDRLISGIDNCSASPRELTRV